MDDTNKPKKKQTRKVSESAEVVPVIDGPPPPPMLTQDELFKIRLFEVEMRAAKAEAETCRMRKKWILALLDHKGSVEAEEKRQAKYLEEAKGVSKKYEAVLARASMRLNLDLSRCGFDAETGLVVPPDSATGKK